MRVLQLGKFYPIKGGVEKVMYDLTLGLQERGVECDMLCAAFDGPTRTVPLGDKARVIACRTLFRLAGAMVSPTLIFRAMRMCRKYDIVHIHHPDPVACMALFLSRYRGKVILHWHSDIIKQKTLLKLYRPLQRWLIRRADLIVGTTPVYLASSTYLRDVQHKTVCLPIGVVPVEPDQAAVQTIKDKYPGKKIIFSLGRLVEYKGYKYLVRAAEYLSDEYIILIGGDGLLKPQLEALIEALEVQDRVKLLGRIADEELPAYYGACTLFCLPSVQATEAFGIVQIEAMSCGKPVVTTKIPGSGVPWVNADGVSGVNVMPRVPRALAEAFRRVTKDEETYSTYCRNSRRRYETVFTQKTMIDNYLDLLWKCKEQNR